LLPVCHHRRQQWVCSGRSFGNGVVLMGRTEVVVLAVLTVFHGLNEGLGVAIDEGFAFK